MVNVRLIVIGALVSLVILSLVLSTLHIGHLHAAYRYSISFPTVKEFIGNTTVSSRGNVASPRIPRTIQQAKLKSTVDYLACCGLGHRMSKLVDAHYIAHVKNFGLRVFFGFCDQSTEVFHHFFGSQPLEELDRVTHQNWSFKINNEVPCFSRITRTGNESECKCPSDFLEQSGIFFSRLMQRFRSRQEVQTFGERHNFANHTVVGLHVRAGNGEQGDFAKKNRQISNASVWVQSLSSIIVNMSRTWIDKPPLLFIATDTASVVSGFRQTLSNKMSVVEYQQRRPAHGSGVIFGQAGANKKLEGPECLLQWKNSIMDMMLLATTDVVIAGRPSSFTQSLPMSIVLSRDQRKTPKAYCEISIDANQFQCFETLSEWCCRGTTKFHLEGIRAYEYRRMPAMNFGTGCNMDHHLQERPASDDMQLISLSNQRLKSSFLPFDWDWIEFGKSRS